MGGQKCARDAADKAPYEHTPLQDGQIRILHVRLDTDDRIECRLRAVDLHAPGPYWAISYVWGSEDAAQEIDVDGKRATVHTNLHAALCAARGLFLSNVDAHGSYIPLWIDAVCINQGDLQERNEQVSIMDTIYKQATGVWVTINEALKETSIVAYVLKHIHLLHIMGAKANTNAEPSFTDASSSPPGQPNTSLEDLEQPEDPNIMSIEFSARHLLRRYNIDAPNLYAIRHIMEHRSAVHSNSKTWLDQCPFKEHFLPESHAFWAGLAAFVNLEYFQRVWTYQELMLTERATNNIMLGRVAVPWDFARALWEAFFSTGLFIDLAPASLMRQMLDDQTGHNWTMRYGQFAHRPGRKGQTASLFLSIANRRCKDPNDYVYGLLGLVELDIRREINVDYSIPHGAVFARFIKLVMARAESWPGKDLLPLMWGDWSTVPTCSELPSWCPDVSNTNNAKTRVGCNMGPRLQLGDFLTQKFAYHAEYPAVQDDCVVALKVLQIGVVERCVNTCCPVTTRYRRHGDWEEFEADALRRWVADLKDSFPRMDEEDYVTGCCEAINEFLWTTSECDRKEEIALEHHWNLYQGVQSHPLDSDGGMSTLQRDWLRSLAPLFVEQRGRYIFQLTSGEIGSAPKPLTYEARVVVVPTSLYLHVLSPDSKQYIACASVPGMHEMLEKLPLEEVESRMETVYLH